MTEDMLSMDGDEHPPFPTPIVLLCLFQQGYDLWSLTQPTLNTNNPLSVKHPKQGARLEPNRTQRGAHRARHHAAGPLPLDETVAANLALVANRK